MGSFFSRRRLRGGLNGLVVRFGGPIYSQDGGTVSFVAQDFTFGGNAIARLSEDGTLIRLGADGQPAGVDRGGNPALAADAALFGLHFLAPNFL